MTVYRCCEHCLRDSAGACVDPPGSHTTPCVEVAHDCPRCRCETCEGSKPVQS